jgi:uncharacterized protein RhaS with RHS repeats
MLHLYNYRARNYDPLYGRFLQRDPAGYIDSMNVYKYVSSNPINAVDPTGIFLDFVANVYAYNSTVNAVITSMDDPSGKAMDFVLQNLPTLQEQYALSFKAGVMEAGLNMGLNYLGAVGACYQRANERLWGALLKPVAGISSAYGAFTGPIPKSRPIDSTNHAMTMWVERWLQDQGYFGRVSKALGGPAATRATLKWTGRAAGTIGLALNLADLAIAGYCAASGYNDY